MFPRFTFSDRDNMEKLFKQFCKFPKKCMKTIQVMQQNIFFLFCLRFGNFLVTPIWKTDGKIDLASDPAGNKLEKIFFRPQAPIFLSHWPSRARPMRDRKNQCLGLEKYEIAIIYYKGIYDKMQKNLLQQLRSLSYFQYSS